MIGGFACASRPCSALGPRSISTPSASGMRFSPGTRAAFAGSPPSLSAHGRRGCTRSDGRTGTARGTQKQSDRRADASQRVFIAGHQPFSAPARGTAQRQYAPTLSFRVAVSQRASLAEACLVSHPANSAKTLSVNSSTASPSAGELRIALVPRRQQAGGRPGFDAGSIWVALGRWGGLESIWKARESSARAKSAVYGPSEEFLRQESVRGVSFTVRRKIF